jgi:hypothetical protein
MIYKISLMRAKFAVWGAARYAYAAFRNANSLQAKSHTFVASARSDSEPVLASLAS